MGNTHSVSKTKDERYLSLLKSEVWSTYSDYQECKCYICNKDIEKYDTFWDILHIIPGNDDMYNLRISCSKCVDSYTGSYYGYDVEKLIKTYNEILVTLGKDPCDSCRKNK
jgi:hypothetical protein